MKRIVLTFAFVLLAQIGLAQDDSFRKDALKVVEICGSASFIKSSKAQIVKMVPPEKQAAFSKEFDAAIPGLLEKMAKIYMETYTKEDIKAMLEFYKTPLGKKMSEKAAEISQKSNAVDQEWVTQGLQTILMKFIS